MAFEDLNEREKQVLYNLVTHYIQTADPVGSRVIANRFRMGVSSATIRNTLQDLEDMGLVEQPHTSAGRIPTDLGYRIYVDFLLKPEALTREEKDAIRSGLLREGRGVERILGQTSRVLGDITMQLGVAIAPRFEEGVLRRIELISISDDRIMVVIVLRSGLARTVILEVEAAVAESELHDLESVLNERLVGLSLREIRANLFDRLSNVQAGGHLVRLIIDRKDDLWSDAGGATIRVAGAEHLVQKPEFADVARITELIRLVEDGRVLREYLREAYEAGVVITIGRENRFAEIMNCSLVTASYKVGNVSGAIGIVGPTRMPYHKLLSVVDYTARTMTEVLSGMDSDSKRDE